MAGLGLHEGKMLCEVNGNEVADKEDALRHLSKVTGEATLGFEEIPVMSLATGVVMLGIVTVLVCAVSEWVCDSIGDFALKVGMSPRFVAFILLPLAGNLPEFVTVVSMAAKGKMDLCVGVAIGSSMQVMTFVVPVMVLIGWWIGAPMTMNYGVLETMTLFLCVIKAWNITTKREASWFEGGSLVIGYIAIAIAFWFWTKEGTPDDVGGMAAAAVNAVQGVAGAKSQHK
jgi:calcium/proton exchanger cax